MVHGVHTWYIVYIHGTWCTYMVHGVRTWYIVYIHGTWCTYMVHCVWQVNLPDESSLSDLSPSTWESSSLH